MFKIKNGVPGCLPVQLEQGSIILQPNKSFDLDGVCSRKWISTDPILNHLINQGHLIVEFDSQQRPLGKTPVTPVNRPHKKKAKSVVPPPVVIDLGVDEDDEPTQPSIKIPKEIKVPKKVKPSEPVIKKFVNQDPVEAAIEEEKVKKPKRKYTRRTKKSEDKPKRKYTKKAKKEEKKGIKLSFISESSEKE